MSATIDGEEFDPYTDCKDLAHVVGPADPAVQTLKLSLKHRPSGGGGDTSVAPVHHQLKLR